MGLPYRLSPHCGYTLLLPVGCIIYLPTTTRYCIYRYVPTHCPCTCRLRRLPTLIGPHPTILPFVPHFVGPVTLRYPRYSTGRFPAAPHTLFPVTLPTPLTPPVTRLIPRTNVPQLPPLTFQLRRCRVFPIQLTVVDSGSQPHLRLTLRRYRTALPIYILPPVVATLYALRFPFGLFGYR